MSWLRNLKIGKKLAYTYGALAVLAAIGGIVTFVTLRQVSSNVTALRQEAEKVRMAQSVVGDVNMVYIDLAATLMTRDPAQRRAFENDIEQHRESYKAAIAEMRRLSTTAEGRRLLDQLDAKIASQRGHNMEVAALAAAGRTTEASTAFVDNSLDDLSKLSSTLDELLAWRQKRVAEVSGSAEHTATLALVLLVMACLGTVVLTVLFAITMTRSITKPLGTASQQLARMADGDYTVAISEEHVARKDEIGDLARSMATLKMNVGSIIATIVDGSERLADSSSNLSSAATQMTGNSRETVARAGTVAAAAEEMTVTVQSVSNGMEKASGNLVTVAAATEEMTATIGEIARDSEKARRITEDARHQAQSASTLIRDLGAAAQDIGKVTETITSISAQTNLLALNATIEAARAGAAGKGFAVVANEIKELAQQTAAATEDIKAKIGGVQASTGGTIDDIEKISQVIGEVSGIVSTIATAIEEQSVVTTDIAANVAHAAAEVQDVGRMLTEATTASRSVASEIATVSHSSGEILSGSEMVSAGSVELADLAARLKDTTQRFRVDGKARVSTGVTGSARSGAGVKPFVEWSDRYATNVSSMDAQHRRFFEIINQLHASMREGRSRQNIASLVSELVRYTEYHFSAEERLMEAHRYPGLNEQKAAHARFVAQVQELDRRVQSGEVTVAADALNMVRDWLVNHIMKMDQKYGPHLSERGRMAA
jgi:methyl-accepting chemotaxis protein